MAKSKIEKADTAISNEWTARLDAEIFQRFRIKATTNLNLFELVYVTSFDPKVKDRNKLQKAHAFVDGFMSGMSFSLEKIRGQK